MVQGFCWVLLEALGIFLGLEFCIHSIIFVTLNPEYLPWARSRSLYSCFPLALVIVTPHVRLHLKWLLFFFSCFVKTEALFLFQKNYSIKMQITTTNFIRVVMDIFFTFCRYWKNSIPIASAFIFQFGTKKKQVNCIPVHKETKDWGLKIRSTKRKCGSM